MTKDPDPYYRLHVFCCTNQRAESHPRGSCKARGSLPLRNHLKVQAAQMGLTDIRVNASGCLNRCELGPVLVIYPEGVWYAVKTTEDIDEILTTHIKDGGRVERLILTPEDGP